MLRKIITVSGSLLRFTKDLGIALLLMIVLYLLFAVLFTLIPSNFLARQPEKGITVYLKSNGVHTDLVVPTQNKFYDWSEHLYPEDFGLLSSEDTWTAIGWGDKGFYLNTPTWGDLKFSTALDAVIPGFGGSAMHVTLYEEEPRERKLTKKLILSEIQYLILCDYIFNSFTKDKKGQFMLLRGHHYDGVNDNFYEALGDYNLFQTCNTWTNTALKKAGVKTAFWAPFDKCILYHF